MPTSVPTRPVEVHRRIGTTELAELAGRSADLLEESRQLTPALAEALSDAGFARHFVPRRRGGAEGSFTELLERVSGLAETCAATAWCASLYAAHGRLAAYLPEPGQRELWDRSPDVRIAAAVVPPRGTAVAEGEGWRVTGEWSFASGVDHAAWVLLAVRPDGADAGGVRVFAVPRRACEIVDSWRSLGMRGTGSNTVVVRELSVPAYRSFTVADLGAIAPGAARCHAVPLPLVAQLQFTAPILGAARAAVRDWAATMAVKLRADGQAARGNATVQQVLARSSGEIHAAGLLLREAAGRADEGSPTPQAIACNQRDFALAAEMCATAVDRLFRASGARGQAEGDPLQRRWRDVTTAAGHASLGFDPVSAAFAAEVFARLGREAG